MSHLNSESGLWALTLVLGEDGWQIDVPAGRFATKAQAEAAAADASVTFERPELPVVAFSYHGDTGYAFDKQVAGDEGCSVNEIACERRRLMGWPLNTRDPQDREMATQALLTQDPAYCIGPEDMVPSAKTLTDFLASYGPGYRPDIIAFRVHRDAPDATYID